MKIGDDVLTELSAAMVDGNKLFLTDKVDRKLYQQINKVLEAAGGKWNRKERAHVFESDAETRIDQIILTGEVEIPKDEFNYFPSPPAVVSELVSLACIIPGMTVLEPSAGRGAIALACHKEGGIVDCVELMRENYEALHSMPFRRIINNDFLATWVDEFGLYDRVVMNPPFAGMADIKHVTHAYEFLKVGGLLVSVMSSGVMFRQNKLTAQFREFVESVGGRFDPLPEGSFRESGTMVNTVIVSIPK